MSTPTFWTPAFVLQLNKEKKKFRKKLFWDFSHIKLFKEKCIMLYTYCWVRFGQKKINISLNGAVITI